MDRRVCKEIFYGKKTLGINKRFRFYKYSEGDFFKLHSDGSWPGSLVVNKELITDFYKAISAAGTTNCVCSRAESDIWLVIF